MNANIEFKRIKNTSMFIASTERAHNIIYTYVDEDRLTLYIPPKEEDKNKTDEDPEVKQPTKLKLECNFLVTGEMLDLMQNSKIMYVLSRKHDFDISLSQVTFLPCTGFEFEKLQDVIVDLCEKFNL